MSCERVVYCLAVKQGTLQHARAIPRGKQDGNTVRPLVWGEEQKRITLPRSEIAAAKKDRSDSGTISYKCVSPDKTRLAAAFGELVSIYSLPDWQSLITLQHDVAIDYIAFSPDSKSIVTSAVRPNTTELWVWDIEDEVQRNKNLLGQQIQRANMKHVVEMAALAVRDALLSCNASMHQSWNAQFSPDSKLLAVGNGDGNLRIWEIRTGRFKHRLSLSGFENIHDHTPLATLSPIRGVSFSSDSNNIFISGGHGKTSLFRLSTCEVLQSFTALRSQDGLLLYEITDLSISHNGNRLGYQTPNGATFVYDMRSNEKWRIRQTLDSERASRKAVGSNLCFLDEAGEAALTTDLDGNMLIWKISDSNSQD